MKRLRSRRYSCGALTLTLVLTVGLVRLLGGGESAAVMSPFQGPAADPTPAPAEETLSLPKTTPAPATETPGADSELLGVWVPYLSLATEEHTREAFEENFRAIADSAADKGLNALFVHVRPFCDALYPSEYFPWSHILTGEQGKDPGFDPLAFMVEYAHSRGLRFHAWLNPLRVKTPETPASLSPDNPYEALKADCPYYFMETDGSVWLDPAWPYVRTLIANGAAEIVERYDVDGVHFDDYFYPEGGEELDGEAYELYAQGLETPLSLLEWRKANISAMVQEVYQRVKAAKPDVEFGISPQGNLANDESMGADVKAWCAVPGYVDYLCPQLYYSFENEALGYGEALSQWTELERHEGVKLYIGLALYKAGSDADNGTWRLSDDTISRQIQSAREAACAGVVLYSAGYLDAPQTKREVENAMAALR